MNRKNEQKEYLDSVNKSRVYCYLVSYSVNNTINNLEPNEHNAFVFQSLEIAKLFCADFINDQISKHEFGSWSGDWIGNYSDKYMLTEVDISDSNIKVYLYIKIQELPFYE